MTIFLFAFSMKQHEDCEKLYFLQTRLFYFSYLNVQGIQREGQTSSGAAASLLCRCSLDTEAPGERCVILSFSFRHLKFWVVLWYPDRIHLDINQKEQRGGGKSLVPARRKYVHASSPCPSTGRQSFHGPCMQIIVSQNQNIWSWKRHGRTIESTSWLHT